MTALFRVVLMFVGYLWACVAAALVLALGTLAPQWDYFFNAIGLQSPEMRSAAEWTVVGFGALIIFVVGFLPTLLIIVITEGFALRSVVIYGVIGGLLALTMAFGLDFAGYSAPAGVDIAREREVFAAAGIAGGLVYWLFAGRNAGIWK
ncbi:MAG TPA: hypothetical protein VMC05_06395 [Xanthobacteraceae bacterium]|nr:hypothetical protein [Xanthobacteraceae bacterium]